MRERGWQRHETSRISDKFKPKASRTKWKKSWISRGERWVSDAFRRWNEFTTSTPSNVGLRGHFLWLCSNMIMKWDHLEKLFRKHPLKYDTHTCSFCLTALWAAFSCRSFFSSKHYRCIIGCGYLLVPTSDLNAQCDYKSELLILLFLTPLDLNSLVWLLIRILGCGTTFNCLL